MNFDPTQLRELTGPGVYLFHRDSEILYIGATSCGLTRCFSSGHLMMKQIRDGISLVFIPMESTIEAFTLEKELIRECNPYFNAKSGGGPIRTILRKQTVEDVNLANYTKRNLIVMRPKAEQERIRSQWTDIVDWYVTQQYLK